MLSSSVENPLRTPFLVEVEDGINSDRSRPFLAHAKPAVRWHSLLRNVYNGICEYWAITTDPIYQQSAASRRPFWAIWFLISAGLLIVIGLCGQDNGIFLHQSNHHNWLLQPLALVIGAFIPHRYNWSDAFIMTGQAVAFWAPILYSDVSVPFCDPAVLADAIVTHQLFAMILSALVGIHAYAALLYILISLTLQHMRWPIFTNLNSPSVVMNYATFIAMIAYTEFSIARLCRNLSNEQRVNEFLLDHATDGFCDVECSSGMICNASARLVDTVASNKLVGQRFIDLFSSCDHTTINSLLENASIGQHEMTPVLVSYAQFSSQPKTISFDAKLLPYTVCKDVIRVVFQIQGEIRRVQSGVPLKQSVVIAEQDECPSDDGSSCGEDVGRFPSESSECVVQQPSTFENMSMFSLDLSATDAGLAFERPSHLPSRGSFSRLKGIVEVGIQVNLETLSKSSCDKCTQSDDFDPLGRPPKFPGTLLKSVPQVCSNIRGRSLDRSKNRVLGDWELAASGSFPSPKLTASGNDAQTNEHANKSGRRRRLTHSLPPA